MIDLFIDLSDTSPEGQFYRSVAVALVRDGIGRIVNATSWQHHQIDGWDELYPRFDDQDIVSTAQLVLGWAAVDEVHRRLALPHYVLVECVTERELTSMRRNILNRARTVFATEPSIDFIDSEVEVLPYCYDAERLETLLNSEPCPGDIVYAIGPWATTRMAVDFYLASGHELGRLLVISEDCPIQTVSDWLEVAGSSSAPAPSFITGNRAVELDEWKAHAQGSVLYCRTDDTYRRLLAAAAGNLVCTDDGDCPWSLLEGGEEPERIVNEQVIMSSAEYVESTALWVLGKPDGEADIYQRPSPSRARGKSFPEYKDGFSDEDLDDDDEFEEPSIGESLELLEHQIAIIVPHMGRGISYVRPAVDCAVSVIAHNVAEVIIVNFGNVLEGEITLEALRKGWTVVWCSQTKWNISLARNIGVADIQVDPDEPPYDGYYLFLDADVLLDRRWREDAAAAMATGNVLVPRVVQGTRLLDSPPEVGSSEPEHVRGGTGMPLVSHDLYTKLGGFDESFDTYGNEDLDFLARARAQGVMTQASTAVCYHNPHPPWAPRALESAHKLGDPERKVRSEVDSVERRTVVRQGRLVR